MLIARNMIQNDIKQFLIWTNQWIIKLNPTKGHGKIFTLRRLNISPHQSIYKNLIIWNNAPVKYLAKRLSWKSHISGNTNNTYGKIIKLYPFINKKSSLKLSFKYY